MHESTSLAQTVKDSIRNRQCLPLRLLKVRIPLRVPRDLLDREIRQSTGEIRELGVEHNDLRPQNMLWNAEASRVLLIDFERSTVSYPSNHRKRPSPDAEVLREVSSNQK